MNNSPKHDILNIVKYLKKSNINLIDIIFNINIIVMQLKKAK